MFTMEIPGTEGPRTQTYSTLQDAAYRKMFFHMKGFNTGTIFDADGFIVPRKEWWEAYKLTELYKRSRG